jgi:hypothetical protein
MIAPLSWLELSRSMLLYDGPSLFDPDERIFVVASIGSENKKTGNCVTIWFLNASEHPVTSRTHEDGGGVCGNAEVRCALSGMGCYVDRSTGVGGLWKSAVAGNLQPFNEERFTAAIARVGGVRVGGDGDCACAPEWVLRLIRRCWVNSGAKFWANYSHFWQLERMQFASAWTMASVHSARDAYRAGHMGWRVFWSVPFDGDQPAGLVKCPHADDASIQCRDCNLCGGTDKQARSVWEPVTGKFQRFLTQDRLEECLI